MPNDNVFILIKKNGEKIYNPQIDGFSVKFGSGHGNTCILHEPLTQFFNSCINFVGSNSFVQIKEVLNHNSRISNFNVRIENNNKLLIGTDFSCNGADLNIDVETGVGIYIGKDVMLSYGIQMRTSDAHAILDLEGNPLNLAKDISIGNHVWIAQNVFMAKGSVIPDNCVVGACSFVNKVFKQENTLIAGNPAHIKKENINWHRTHAQYLLNLKERIKK